MRERPRYCVPSILLTVCALSVASAQQSAAAPTESLAPVVVSAPKLTVETLIDRKVYHLTDDVQSTFGTAGDLLSTIPSLEVDGDGVVSLRGDSNVLILIDGKPSALFAGASAGDNLQSLPASAIERIEIITNPPPQYQADGAAGIINIITRKHRASGLNGTVQASVGSQGRYQWGSSAGYQSGPLNVSVSALYRQDLRHRLQSSDLIAPDSTGALVDSESRMNEDIHRAIPPVAVAAEYALDDRDSLNIALGRTGRGGLRTYTELNDTVMAGNGITQASQRLSSGHDAEVDYDEKLGFTRQLGGSNDSINFTLHRTTSHENEHYDYSNAQTLPLPPDIFYDYLGFQEQHATTEADLDYARSLSKHSNLKLGYAYEQDDYGYLAGGAGVDPVTGAQSPESQLTDAFRYRQSIHAGYATWEAQTGHFDWLGGVRTEWTLTDGQQLTQGQSTQYDYLRLYPSFHLDDHVSEESTLSLAASRRVTRPDPDNLNPYIDYEYTPNLRTGNANLRPQYTDSFETGYSYQGRKFAYSLTGYYRHNSDSVTDIIENFGNGLTLATKANLPRNDSSGLEFTASGHLLPELGYSVSGNVFYSQIDAAALGTAGLRSTTGLNGKLKLDYRPTRSTSAQIIVSRSDKRLTPQGYVSAIDVVNLGARQGMAHNLTAVVTVSDLFNGQRLLRVADTPSFTEQYQRQVLGRVVWVGVEYSFGVHSHEQESKFEYDEASGR